MRGAVGRSKAYAHPAAMISVSWRSADEVADQQHVKRQQKLDLRCCDVSVVRDTPGQTRTPARARPFVEDVDVVPACEQLLGEVRADEACPTGMSNRVP